jgi:hypothetical protein
MYKTFVIGYHPKTETMAEELEKKANELANNGLRIVSFSVTNSGKGILLAEDTGCSNG